MALKKYSGNTYRSQWGFESSKHVLGLTMNSTYISYNDIPGVTEEICYFHRHQRSPAST